MNTPTESMQWRVRRNKIQIYRVATDAQLMLCINDRPECAFASIHQAIDLPFAMREAKRRGLKPNASDEPMRSSKSGSTAD